MTNDVLVIVTGILTLIVLALVGANTRAGHQQKKKSFTDMVIATLRNLSNKTRRFFGRHRWLGDYEKSLNRRAQVEQELLDIANGKAPMPSREACREMALKLGVPEKWRD